MGYPRTKPKGRTPNKYDLSLEPVRVPPVAASALPQLWRSQRCLKCQGLLFLESINGQPPETRCVNCGWQPVFYTPIITAPPEEQASRELLRSVFKVIE